MSGGPVRHTSDQTRSDAPRAHSARAGLALAMIGIALPLALLVAGLWLGSASAGLLAAIIAMLALCALTQLLLGSVRREHILTAALKDETRRREMAEAALLQSQKMEAIGRLTGGIAHDFNNHLTVINSNIELLKRRLPDGSEHVLHLADAAMQGVQRAASLAHRLLTFSRQQPREPEPTDLGRLVFGMTELLRRTLGETIEVRTRLSATLWPTTIDASQFENAMLNLAVNARDAMPAGGKLLIETANVSLDAAAAGGMEMAPGDYVLISASDAEPDAATDMLSDRSDPLVITELLGQDVGLGLSMVHDFARQSGGQARIDITSGSGVRIRLYLPRHVEATPAVAHPASSMAVKTSAAQQTVLVVEDDDAVRQSAVEALRDLGYQVLEAPDAMEAIRLIVDRGNIDLLFTDIGLPGGVSGRALADAARNACATLKILFTTGYTQAVATEFARPHEQVHFLAKPFSLEQLEAMVHDVLTDAPPRVVAAPVAAP